MIAEEKFAIPVNLKKAWRTDWQWSLTDPETLEHMPETLPLLLPE